MGTRDSCEGGNNRTASAPGWLREVARAYGGIKPSMLQDFERHRTTEIDFINGHVVDIGRTVGVVTPANAAIVDAVQAISRRDVAPGPEVLARVLARVDRSPLLSD